MGRWVEPLFTCRDLLAGVLLPDLLDTIVRQFAHTCAVCNVIAMSNTRIWRAIDMSCEI
jgi:hypothetical protein